MRRQGGQLRLTARATCLSDVNTGQTVVPNRKVLVADVVGQRLAVHGAGAQDGLMASWVRSSSKLDRSKEGGGFRCLVRWKSDRREKVELYL